MYDFKYNVKTFFLLKHYSIMVWANRGHINAVNIIVHMQIINSNSYTPWSWVKFFDLLIDATKANGMKQEFIMRILSRAWYIYTFHFDIKH